MKLSVHKNHLGGQILYKIPLGLIKKRRQRYFINQVNIKPMKSQILILNNFTFLVIQQSCVILEQKKNGIYIYGMSLSNKLKPCIYS